MALIMVSGEAPFSTYPRAPARMAANTDSSSSNMVSIKIATSGAAFVIWRVASMPPMPGIWMSMITTSGRRVTAARTASSPVRVTSTSS